MQSLLSCVKAREFFSEDDSRTIQIHWTPAHVGFEPNEEVDKMAKAAANQGYTDEDVRFFGGDSNKGIQDYRKSCHPNFKSWSYARSRTVMVMNHKWRKDAKSRSYHGAQLNLPDRIVNNLSHVANSHFILRTVGNLNIRMARVCRVLTGHAPTGEFRERFKLDGPITCICGAAPHGGFTREHLLFNCPFWENWELDQKNRPPKSLWSLNPLTRMLDDWLRVNFAAFSFELGTWQQMLEGPDDPSKSDIENLTVKKYTLRLLVHNIFERRKLFRSKIKLFDPDDEEADIEDAFAPLDDHWITETSDEKAQARLSEKDYEWAEIIDLIINLKLRHGA